MAALVLWITSISLTLPSTPSPGLHYPITVELIYNDGTKKPLTEGSASFSSSSPSVAHIEDNHLHVHEVGSVVLLAKYEEWQTERSIEVKESHHDWTKDPHAMVISEKYYPEGLKDALQNNLNYFRDDIGIHLPTQIPLENLQATSNTIINKANYTNISAIGLYINILIEVQRAGSPVAAEKLSRVLDQLENAPNFHGLFHWLYNFSPSSSSVPPHLIPTADGGVVSAVDNGNMASSLAALCGAYRKSKDQQLLTLSNRAFLLLRRQVEGWNQFYDPEKQMIRGAYRYKEGGGGEFQGYYIDRKTNESRLSPLWAVLLTQQLGKDSNKTPIPTQVFKNMKLYTEEHRLSDGELLTPALTWDGSYFQGLAPMLFFDEETLLPNFQMWRDFSTIHKNYAQKHGIPFLSACSTIDDGYGVFGVYAVTESDQNHEGKVGTPHASALFYMIDEQEAVKHLIDLQNRYPNIQSLAGWYDAVEEGGEMSSKLIAWDQGLFTCSFFAKKLREDVREYVEGIGGWGLVEEMYKTCVVDYQRPSRF